MGLLTQIIVADMANADDLSRIISADFKKNHAGRDYDEASALRAFKAYCARGGEYFHTPNCIVIYREQVAGVVEFHCFNGGSGADLTGCVSKFLHFVRPVASVAVTYYDNPKISELLKFLPFESQVNCIAEGEDRTFEAAIDLSKERAHG